MNPTTRAWLEITRLSNLPTVLSGVVVMSLASLFLFNGRDYPLSVVGLLIAISCFYAGGFIFNDVFDRHIDQDERPSRPIPSGRIRTHSAVQVGILLLVVGLMIIASLDELFTVTTSERGEPNGLIDAVLLIILILVYNRFHAKSAWMVFVIAACRVLVYTTVALTLIESRADLFSFLDVQIASSWYIFLVFPWPLYLIAIFFYVAAFSYLARPEAVQQTEDCLYCYKCGFGITDKEVTTCSECGHTFDSKRLAQSTAPPPGRLQKLCLFATFLPWGFLCLSTLILAVMNQSMSQRAPNAGLATTAVLAIMTIFTIAIVVIVGTWFLAAMRRYLYSPGQPGPAILMWLAGIPLLDGLLAFYLGAPWIALICLGLFLVTVWGHRRIVGT